MPWGRENRNNSNGDKLLLSCAKYTNDNDCTLFQRFCVITYITVHSSAKICLRTWVGFAFLTRSPFYLSRAIVAAASQFHQSHHVLYNKDHQNLLHNNTFSCSNDKVPSWTDCPPCSTSSPCRWLVLGGTVQLNQLIMFRSCCLWVVWSAKQVQKTCHRCSWVRGHQHGRRGENVELVWSGGVVGTVSYLYHSYIMNIHHCFHFELVFYNK